jgi:hypothetical protein
MSKDIIVQRATRTEIAMEMGLNRDQLLRRPKASGVDVAEDVGDPANPRADVSESEESEAEHETEEEEGEAGEGGAGEGGARKPSK